MPPGKGGIYQILMYAFLKRKQVILVRKDQLVIAHTCNDNDDNQNPKDHIKVEVCASAATCVASAVTHDFASFHSRFFKTVVIYTMFF